MHSDINQFVIVLAFRRFIRKRKKKS